MINWKSFTVKKGNMDLLANIKGIKYHPLMCKDLIIYDFMDLEKALDSSASFIIKISKENQIALSWWVSPKRTRSYPYARVYDTLSFSGKKITVIPVLKDEGREGDRDFLQWDTISLMSLLGVYVIIAYYSSARRSSRYNNKITSQRFDTHYIKNKVNDILSFHSDALHWNLSQIENIGEVGLKALAAYDKISDNLNVELHSRENAERRIMELLEDKDNFMNSSRILAQQAQKREQQTLQPKEFIYGTKATLTIQNYLGGHYYFTADEARVEGKDIFLIEAKNCITNTLPSISDIKDGLLKMILFTNLENLMLQGSIYNPIAVLKLTVANHFNENNLSNAKKRTLGILREEAEINNFKLELL